MSNIFKRLSIARMLTAAVVFAGFVPAKAAEASDYRLTIEPFSVSSYDVVEVPVLLETPDPCDIAALQFKIVMPGDERLQFIGVRQNAARFADGHAFSGSATDYGAFVQIISMNRRNLVGNSGAIAYLSVQAAPGSLSEDKPVEIDLTGIVLTDGSGRNEISLPDERIEVGVHPHVAVTTGEERFVMNPGTTHRISVSMDNGISSVIGFQVNVDLPVGFTIKAYYPGARILGMLDPGDPITVTEDGESLWRTVFLVYDLFGEGGEVISGNSGEVFSFDVVAPEDFTAAEAKVELSGVILSVSSTTGSIYGTGTSVTVVNGKSALDRAEAELQGLDDALAAALARISEEAADVKDDFTGTEISGDITELRTAVEAAYADFTLTDNYDEIMAPVATISEAIEALVAAALDAQAAYDKGVAEKEALDRAEAELQGLDDALTAALARISEEAADVKDDFAGTEISEDIASLRTSVGDAYSAGTLSDTYDDVMAPATAISEAIETLVAAALDAQQAYEEDARKQRNEDAYNADVEALDALQTKLDETDSDLKENYAGAYNEADRDLIQDAIDDARKAIDDAYAAVAESGEYAGSVDSQTINDMIEAWIEKVHTSGIAAITVDSFSEVEAAYTLDGVRHARPVAGQVNIVVIDGKMIKVYVKR